jgi:hypothetical protein
VRPNLGASKMLNSFNGGVRMASQGLSRGFHRLGLFIAAIVLAIGIAVDVADIVRLGPWAQKDLPVLIPGVLIGLIILGVACVAAYGLVRAIGWIIGGFVN